MGSTTEITASPKLRSMFAVAAFIMLALWGWSLVPPIENWGNPNEDGFSYVPVFYTTIICLPVGIYLLVGAIAGHGRYVRRARTAFFIAAGITLLVVAFLVAAFNLITRMVAKCELPALGQKRTRRGQIGMSALLPKADIPLLIRTAH
jgi:hypothetical protein